MYLLSSFHTYFTISLYKSCLFISISNPSHLSTSLVLSLSVLSSLNLSGILYLFDPSARLGHPALIRSPCSSCTHPLALLTLHSSARLAHPALIRSPCSPCTHPLALLTLHSSAHLAHPASMSQFSYSHLSTYFNVLILPQSVHIYINLFISINLS
ncbi:unnamed protein product [Acanthosepion pharaonis]|uniref:Uncharacterized protein n=1 Tax=Acanthosepion pharaonis TaxID=158019 RepID=A0A812BL53_ACAPH|nr:unnamed protein product [Sepia pharaonis]